MTRFNGTCYVCLPIHDPSESTVFYTDRCFCSSQYIGQVIPKIIYFCYGKNKYLLDQSISKIFNLILKNKITDVDSGHPYRPMWGGMASISQCSNETLKNQTHVLWKGTKLPESVSTWKALYLIIPTHWHIAVCRYDDISTHCIWVDQLQDGLLMFRSLNHDGL